MKCAFIFPGQGSQKTGMGKELFDNFEQAKTIFNEANEALGENFSDLIFNNPGDQLTLTANTQPAILTVSIAALRCFEEICNIKPDFLAGHSLGEFSALVASSALEFKDAVKITRDRGTYMQEAVPPGEGAMAAVMKLEEEVIIQACKEASQDEIVSPANFNCPGQIVISGTSKAVKRATNILKDKGGRVIPLKVSAPFHCNLMEPAAKKLEKTLNNITFGLPIPGVVTNVNARVNQDPNKIKELLVSQVTSTVKWTESVKYMIDNGVNTFIEFGPGNILTGLISRIDPDVKVISAGKPEELDKAKELLAQSQE